MKNSMKWIVLAASVLWLSGCTRSSEAKVNIYNKGALSIKATIYYTTSEIAPGQRETFKLTWPGRGSLQVNMVYYPGDQPARAVNQDLELNNGDDLTFEVEFAAN